MPIQFPPEANELTTNGNSAQLELVVPAGADDQD
jgi:hypothetical protein